MLHYEYKVVPAPKRGEKQRGLKTTEDRFAQTLTQLMNTLGREGWEYLRAEALPCEERVGFTGKSTSYQNLLIFRRALTAAAAQVTPQVAAPVAAAADPAAPRLGAAQTEPGAAPAVGPVRPELAAE
ncbi:DUF4177 domain-containing protein [Gemmobacter fulvus]|uniref:DUF4177 domain-containing protein n=1 Tax=Gemmobacter fulvus TaxID=2840474 RepID=UPI0027966218|nr:DUF4177 domain-containing protein [Gemmobacter fulvus]MDQ1848585.1 DUF4177 domain-containing protein [Gemmobacter fulvus]